MALQKRSERQLAAQGACGAWPPSGQLNETINVSGCLSLAVPSTPLQIRRFEVADWPAVGALLE
ncbi:MAG: hypothetical protein ACKOPS_19920, partial [Cyanobium sp.]